MPVVERLTFIHLSDIHFPCQSNGGCFDLDRDIRHELLRDVAALAPRIGPVTGVLVTGDIAFSGDAAEYDGAGKWLDELCLAAGCPGEKVWVVPGNHDVNRAVVADSELIQLAHETLRRVDDVDLRLRRMFADLPAARMLLEPLAAYNLFAARYQCAIDERQPYWEKDLVLGSGMVLRIRGLSSVLASDSDDEKGNLVLGAAQVAVARQDGVEYMTLCHHPPEWLRDRDACEDRLLRKVRVQLFGHRHRQRIWSAGNGVRLAAGAMHPDRRESGWVPIYNVVQMQVVGVSLHVRVYARRWREDAQCFVPEPDPDSGQEISERSWEVTGMTAPPGSEPPAASADQPAAAQQRPEVQTPSDVAAEAEGGSAVTWDPERRLVYRFLTLPFRHQIAIAQGLGLLEDSDGPLARPEFFQALFQRAADRGCLEQLWRETEAHHGDSELLNPFAGQ